MNGFGRQLFAGARLARHRHVDRGLGGLLHQPENAAHGRAVALHDLAEIVLALELAFEAFHPLAQVINFAQLLNGVPEQLLGVVVFH